MVDAYRLAADDPYRAATHNKGIMNGISAVVLATGNDTRAVEAGCHSHAVADGRYTTLSHLEKDARRDISSATLEVPMPVGLVGGATKTHPTARAAVKLARRRDRRGAGQVIVAVGLAQNIGRRPRARDRRHPARPHDTARAQRRHRRRRRAATRSMTSCSQLVAEGQVRQDRAEEILERMRASVAR